MLSFVPLTFFFIHFCQNPHQTVRTTLLGRNIKMLRKERNVTQSALAESLGLKRNHIASYEAGIVEPRALTFLRLANYFDVLPEALLTTTLTTDVADRPTFRSQPLTSAMVDKLLGELVGPSRKMKQLIGTFRQFYEQRIQHLDGSKPTALTSIEDFTNFFELLDDLLRAERSEAGAVAGDRAEKGGK